MSLKTFLRSDTYFTGIILALILPILSALLILPAGRIIIASSKSLHFFDSGLFLLCLIPNLLFMRYFMVRVKEEKTGKALLALTVLLILLFFIFVHGHPFNLPF
jgi:hypothetical protein